MDSRVKVLFTPMKIGTAEIKNRIIHAPMEGTNIIEWFTATEFNENVHDYYVERAKDGVGLIIPGMIPLRSFMGDKWLPEHPEVFQEVPRLMDEIHTYGAKVFSQLGAGWGRAFTLPPELTNLIGIEPVEKPGMPKINMNAVMIAADEGSPNVWMPEYKCREITIDEIREYVEAYANVALLCKNAGVDGVEVHAVHEGYLMDQFTTAYTNHRSDEYGGSFENRYRFAVEVVQAIKEKCGQDYPVSLRYSVTSKTKGYNQGAVPGEEFIEAGRTMEESERAIRYLQDAGYDCFNCDNGTYDAWYWAHPPVYMPLNCNLTEVAHIKKYVDVPVFCAGRMQVDAAAQAITEGKIDGVAIGRQFLCDEHFITKIRENDMEDVRPCISCHAACLPVATFKNGGAAVDTKSNFEHRKCALNPRTFNEKKYDAITAGKKKGIAVVGGGIAGMEFAIQAAKRGHKVTLYEKSGELGGVFIAASIFSYKEKDKELLEWYRRQLKKVPVEVRLYTEVKDVSELDADEIVIATGSSAKKLVIPGGEKAIDAVDFLLGRKKAGDRVAIIGGGLTGCEIAYELALQGKSPIVIEMMDDIIKVLGVCAANSTLLRSLLIYHNVPVYLEAKTREIKDKSIIIETKEGIKEIFVDSVITSIGYNAGTPLAEKNNNHIHILGDANEVGNLKSAIWAANDLVTEI